MEPLGRGSVYGGMQGTTSSSPGKAADAPVQSRHRFVGVDVLRGVAIFGILVVNVEQLFFPLWISESPLAMVPGEWGAMWIWALTDAIFRTKFLTIFSLLFGAGFALQWTRSREARFGRIYLRRIIVILLFGALHATFFYMADVLVIYGLTALALLLLRGLSPKAMVWSGAVLWLLTLGWYAVISGPEADQDTLLARQAAVVEEIDTIRRTGVVELDGVRHGLPLPASVSIPLLDEADDPVRSKVEYAVFGAGPLSSEIAARLGFFTVLLLVLTPFYVFWRTLALFLVGAGLVRLGLLELGPANERRWRAAALWGAALGLPLTLCATWLHWASFSRPGWTDRAAAMLQEISAILLAFGLAGVVLLASRRGLHSRLLTGFSSVGRTALTNYLGQSVVAAFVATSYGLGLFGDLARWQTFAFAVALFGTQMVVSTLWMRRYRMGPLEWLWRMATYARAFPILRKS